LRKNTWRRKRNALTKAHENHAHHLHLLHYLLTSVKRAHHLIP
jgi:hypothetical protein